MAPRDCQHLLVRRPADAEPYSPHRRKIETPRLPAPADRQAHGTRLAAELRSVAEEELGRREQRPFAVEGAVDGIYVVFESFPGIHLALERLDPRGGRRHPELVSLQVAEAEGALVERATVFVPEGTLGYFLGRIDQYLGSVANEKPRHSDLVDRVHAIGLASLRELWTDPPGEFPSGDDPVWWELWLRRRDGLERERLAAFVHAVGARLGRHTLGFADRTIVLIKATAGQLSRALDVLDDLAELRRPRRPATHLATEPATEQAAQVQRLAHRTRPAPDDAPAACIVDTGVHQTHPLLAGSLAPRDCQACDPNWGAGDHEGHGTELAGLALYGDLGAALLSNQQVPLRHRLESVKILPPPPAANPPELYGALTATAASLAELGAPGRRRVFALATTAYWQTTPGAGTPRFLFGQPTSWSAAVDALAAGIGIDVTAEGMVFLDEGEEAARRLFLLSAGNVDRFEADHLTRSDLSPAEDPAQAWNALTVGAWTELDALDSTDPDFEGWVPIAPRGELSPFSRTSVTFGRGWPIKPDVVLEGGNVARSPAGTEFDTPDALQLLTTKAPLRDARLLTVTHATSAATAQAAHLAASILADYPTLWPETVRALLVHSAEWTPVMAQRFEGARSRNDRLALQRRYGMGVPNLLRATRSATDALTLVVQDAIHPFDGQGRMREMHFHDLPWPADVLAELDADVRLRVTLSYFIEPNPGSRGWVRRYSYASHGLRFEMRRPLETNEEFRKRINQKALEEEERRPTSDSDAAEWFFGPKCRGTGSLHADIWTGPAAELAQRSAVAVFPVTGWWKERKDRDHSGRGARYALVVSIETPGQEVDIWTPVAQEIGIPVEV